jgi:MarR family transcriptional regulator, transcriptional regulator for hemolysin
MSADDSFPTPRDELAFLLEEVPRSLRRKFDERTHEYGLSRTHWRILAYLLREPGMSQSELARCLELERMTISLALEKMEESGLVERRRSSSDRRMQHVHALPKARNLLPRLRVEADATYAELLRDIPEDRIADLRETLESMAANLKRL